MKIFNDGKSKNKQELLLENGFKVVVYEGYYLNETTEPRDFENVVCFDISGKIIWKINGMNECEYWKKKDFVGVGKYEDGTLVATDFEGFVFEVNKNTGRATFLKWVK